MKKGVSILLVEDDLVDIKTVQRAFKENKITNPLHVVENGEEALAYLRNEGSYSDTSKAPRPGVILLDLNMPVMNGVEFMEIAKADEDLKTIPIVVLTTSREEADRMKSYKHSAAGYIVKPVEFAKFVDAIQVFSLYWTLSELPKD